MTRQGNYRGVSNFHVVDGLAAGLAGGVAMTLVEKVEQRFTGRPNSYVPAVTLGRLVGVPDKVAQRSTTMNLGMHFGQAVALGWCGHDGRGWPARAARISGVCRRTPDQ